MTVRARIGDRILRRAAAIRDDPYDDDDSTRGQEAPWSPVPTRPARRFIAEHRDAAIEVVFPSVYEEDRTAKIQDLVTANAIQAITHKRMAEQVAKELGYEEYSYEEEKQQLDAEQQARALTQPMLGAGDQIAQKMPGAAPGAQLPGASPPGAPAQAALLAPPPAPLGGGPDARQPHRAELAGAATRRFRRQQREAETAALLGTMSQQIADLTRRVSSREGFAPEQHPRAPAGGGDGGQFVAAGKHPTDGHERPDEGVDLGAIDRDVAISRTMPVAKVTDPTPEELEWLAGVEQEPDVIAARAEIAAQTPTTELYGIGVDSNGDRIYTPARTALHEQIVRDLLNPQAVAAAGSSPVASLVIGAPASGKSEVLVPKVPGYDRSTIIDTDKIKAKLPEFGGGTLAAAVQHESADIGEGRLLYEAVKRRHNIVLDMVGRTSSKALDMVAELRKNGYQVDLYHIANPPLQSAQRAMARFRKKGRFVPPDYIIKDVDHRPDVTYQKLRASGLLRKWESYDNDVPKGTLAKLQDRGAAARESGVRLRRGRGLEDPPAAGEREGGRGGVGHRRTARTLKALMVEVQQLRHNMASLAPTIHVQPAESTAPLIEVVSPPARRIRRSVERNADGLITGIVDEAMPPEGVDVVHASA